MCVHTCVSMLVVVVVCVCMHTCVHACGGGGDGVVCVYTHICSCL